MSLSKLAGAFEERFGLSPVYLSRAPGRVNLIGEHIDYNDGFVLPMAIERYFVFAATPSQGAAWTIHSVDLDSDAEIDLAMPITRGEPPWSNYIRGVIAGFQQRGSDVPAFNATMTSTVPQGGGLSSSAASAGLTAMS